jgi:hypothetical protein
MSAANVWVALATPNSPANAIPFIDPTSLTPDVDGVNFKFAVTQLYALISGGLKTSFLKAGAAGAFNSGSVASGIGLIAAAQQSIVVTNPYVKDVNTLVIPFLLTDDVTAKSVIAVPAAGSVTLKLNAAATAQVSVGFLILRNSETEV